VTRPPTGERGGSVDVLSYSGGGYGLPGWQEFGGDPTEYVPELQWPVSVQTYEQQRNDSQVAALYNGATWPIRRYGWALDPRAADEGVTRALAEDLGLGLVGEDVDLARPPLRFDWADHLGLALQALCYGHYVFELVGEIDGGMWRLRKLGARPPRTISKWNVASDGGLDSVEQEGPNAKPIVLPVSRLLVYCWDREPGSWVGRSMLRAVYKNWLLKDRLLRVDTINHERSGGMPFIEAPEGASQRMVDALAQMAQEMRVGERSGGAGPAGSRLTLPGPSGSDVVASIRYHDEAMARAWLMMFVQLGQTQTGSRALGESFIDWFSLAQETIAEWICGTFTQVLIRRYFEWNVGAEAPICALVYERDPNVSVEVLNSMLSSGAVVMDTNLAAWIRSRYQLPESAEPEAVRREPPPLTLPAPEEQREPAEAPPVPG